MDWALKEHILIDNNRYKNSTSRFVTSIVKLPQSKYYKAQPMHCLATEIGLPMHLVDLRNEIVHGYGGWGGGEAVFKALEVAYKWIKVGGIF